MPSPKLPTEIHPRPNFFILGYRHGWISDPVSGPFDG